jgi:hypothetical protein
MWTRKLGFSDEAAEPPTSYLPKINIKPLLQNTFLVPHFKMPSPAHLISKVGDPIFAAVIGLSAAATRINREEKELGHSTQQTIDAGLRYA